MSLFKIILLCLSLMILNINGQCTDKTSLINQIFAIVEQLLNSLLGNSSGYQKLLNQLSTILTATELSELNEFNNIIACVTDILGNNPTSTSCSFTGVLQEPLFLLDIVNKLLPANSNYLDTQRNIIHKMEALNTNKAENTLLTKALQQIQSLIQSQCNVQVSMQSSLINVKTTTSPKDLKKINAQINKINVDLNDIINFEQLVNTLDIVIADGDSTLLGIKALSKVVAFLHLTPFFDEILTVLLTDFPNILNDIGNSLITGQGLIESLDSLFQTLLSVDFFQSLSQLLNIQDLSTVLNNLLTLVVALLVDVLLLVESLLLLLAQLVSELAEILGGLVIPI
jgi:hypothetical protein